jgi:hypothetical protein
MPFAGNVVPASRFNPIAVKALSYYPEPTWAGQGPGQINNYTKATPYVYGINQEASRIDYHINSANRVHFRYSNTPYKEVRVISWGTNVAEPSANAPLARNGVNWSGDWTSVISPTTIFDLRFGLTRWEDFAGNYFGAGFNPTELGFPQSLVSQFSMRRFPAFTFADNNYSQIGSLRPGTLGKDYAYSLQPNLNLVRGSHIMKNRSRVQAF